MAKVLKISFSEAEEDLYNWLLSKTNRRNKNNVGLSEFVKDLLWSIYISEATGHERSLIYTVKSFRESTRCNLCGGVLSLRAAGEEGGKKYLQLYCRKCMMIQVADLDEVLELDSLRKI